MGKVFKKTLGFVAAVVVSAVGVALAPATGGASLVFAGKIATALFVGNLLTLTASLFIKKPSMDLSAVVDRLNATINPNALGKFVFGQTAAATDMVYAEARDNRYITQIFEAAAHEVNSFKELYLEDELAINSSGVVQSAWSGIITRYTNLGTEGQTALSIPGTLWPSSARGRGKAQYAIRWDLKNGKDKLSGGIPSRITQIIEAAKTYDPRLDTTVGGSGSHRANDQSTWSYNSNGNLALIALSYIIGYRTNSKLVFGVGEDLNNIDYASFMAAANICEETVDSKPRYKVGGLLETNNDHSYVLSQLEAAIGAKIARQGGKWAIWVPNDDIVGTGTGITEDDLLRQFEIQFSPAGEIQDLFNTARGRFVDPSALYQLVPYPEVIESAAVTLDGRERVKEHDFSIIQDVSIAERVARYFVRRSRFSAVWRVGVGPMALQYKPFDVLNLNIRETNFEDVLVRIIQMQFSSSGVIALDLLEEDASIYDDTVPLGSPITQLDPTTFNPATTYTVSGLAAADASVTGGAGSAKDYLLVSWDDPGGFIRETEIQYRKKTTTEVLGGTPMKVDFTSSLVGPVIPETVYEIRARHISISGAVGDWSSWVEETSGATETVAGIVGQGDLATQDVAAPTIALQINKAFSSGAATALASDSGEAVLHGFNADGTEAPDVDPVVWWAGRKLTLRRYEEDGHLATLLTSLASKRGFIAYSIGDDTFPMNGATTFNQLTYSEEFNNAAWSKSNVTVTPNAAYNYLGLLTADKIEATTSAATTLSRVVSGAGSATGAAYSIYAKKGSGATDANKFYLRNETTATNLVGISFNYDTGAITYLQGGSGGYLAAAEDVGNGWWRIKLTASAGISAGNDLRIYVGFSGNSETAGEYCYVDRAMLQVGATVGGYQMRWAAGVMRRAAFVYKSGSQWYYDNNAGATAFTPNASILALGWLETGSADTISGGGLFGHPVSLLQASFPAADITSENTSADTSTVSGVPAKQILLSQTEIFESWSNYASVSDIPWDITGAANVSLITTTDSGGKAIRCGDNSGNDEVTAICRQWLDFTPEDLWKAEVDIEVEFSGSGKMYFGVKAEDNAGANLTSHNGTYHYQAGSNEAMNFTGRKKYVGYIRGHVGAGVNSGYRAATPDNPKPLANNTVRMKPLFIVNYNGQAGQVIIHSFRLRKIIDATPNYRGTWSSSVTYYKDDAVDYQGRRFMALVKHTNTTPPTSETSTSTWLYIGLQPGEAGADVTGNNTAADTAAVDGTAASTVKNNAANGAAAWAKFSGAGNTLPSGNVEFNFAGSSSKGGNATNTDNVGSQASATVQNATINFNGRNDRNAAAVTAPTIASDGTAVDHTVNTDGSANISFEWSWGGTEADIDGFIIYLYQSTSSSSYTFGTSPSAEQVFYVTPEKRAFLNYGIPVDQYYTFGVQAYRIVDPDINAAGVIKSSIVKPSLAAENPYRPASSVAFAGNVTGTINGTAASTIQGSVTSGLNSDGTVKDNKVTTPAVQDGAGAIVAAAYTSGSITTSSDSVWSTAQSITVTDSTAEIISIKFALHAINLGGGWTKSVVRVRRNLNSVDTYVWGGSGGASFIVDNDGGVISGGTTDTVSVGDDPTYYVEFKKYTGYTGETLSISHRHAEAIEDKFA